MTTYAERLLTTDDREDFARRASAHFAGASETMSNAMGTPNAAFAHFLLALEEDNLWACLDSKRPRPLKKPEEYL